MDKCGIGRMLLAGSFFCTCLLSNNAYSTGSIEGQRIDRTKPTVYISFNEFVSEIETNAVRNAGGVRFTSERATVNDSDMRTERATKYNSFKCFERA